VLVSTADRILDVTSSNGIDPKSPTNLCGEREKEKDRESEWKRETEREREKGVREKRG